MRPGCPDLDETDAMLRFLALLSKGKAVLHGLPEEDLDPDPLIQFGRWFDAARKYEPSLPDAVCLATAGADGAPSARMMLLKGYDADGFRFYTNTESRKAGELDATAGACMVFHWKSLERQVRVEGAITPMTHDESDAYFQSRPRGSRIGAWASKQSHPIASRKDLEREAARRRKQFGSGPVPLPPFWGGYRLLPDRIEFWQARANRLHDRLLYTRTGGRWEITRLCP